MPSAGQIIKASHLPDADGVTLTNQSASAINTWTNWGSETIVFVNPGIPVKVLSTLHGQAVNGVDAVNNVRVRVGISFDSGSIFTTGTESQQNIGTSHGTREQVSVQHFRLGTPTGDIVVKAQIFTDDLSAAFQSGWISAIMVAD